MSFSRLRTSAFWMLWTATAVANLADGVFKLALPLLATQLTDSPGLVAGVAFAVRLPWLLFALFAGVIADRVDRRRTMIVANTARVVVLGVLFVSIVMNFVTLPLIYAVALLLGITETLADTASASILPSMVPVERLELANARLVGAITVTNEFVGPPLGGALAAISLGLAFATSSGLYLVAAVALVLMTGTYKPVATTRAPLVSELMSGVRYVWRNALLRTLAIIVAVMNIGWSAWAAVMVLYVIAPGPGGLTEFEYGIMLTSIGIGGFVGAIVAVPIVERLGRRWAIGADIVGTFLMLWIPAITANAWAIGAAAVLGGIGGSMWSIVVSAIRQQMVPDDMQGKTSGVFRLFGYGALSVGAALAGFIGEQISIPAAFAVCAVMTALLLVPFFTVITPEALTVKPKRTSDLPEPIAGNA
jgi:MFS family permease